MSLDQLVARLAPKFVEEFLKRPARPCRIFLSASDMKTRAITRHASDIDPTVAFNAALEQLSAALGAREPIVLRADWITGVESMTWADFNNLIGSVKRNDFNRGVAFSPDFSVALTALELNANLILYSADNPNGVFNLKAVSSYVRARFDRDLPPLDPSSPIAVFDTAGAFVLGDNAPQLIDATGHRLVETPDVDLTRQIIRSDAQYLDRQLLNSGRFVYGRLPCTDRFVPSYDGTHHIIATLALLAAYDVDGRKNDHLRGSIERAIKYGVETYAELLSDNKYATLKAAFDGFLSDQTVPDVKELLPIVGADDPRAATETRAKELLDDYFWVETAMFFARPEGIFGGFFSRSDAFRVRIDDAARALMSLIEWSKHAPVVERIEQLDLPKVETKVETNVEQTIQKMVESIGINRSGTPRGAAKIFFGGNINFGRRMNLMPSTMKHFEEIPAMRSADIRIANLMCVLSAVGEPVDKGYFFYFRGRPELTNILSEGGIDVALMANHHACDYGAAALVDQNKTLEMAGIAHVGSGANIDEASKPIYVKANGLTVAIFSVDATTEQIGATTERGGVWHLPFDDIDRWGVTFNEKIAEAQKHADAVFVAVDWEPVGRVRDFNKMRAIGRALIDSGADGVLGCDSYRFNRVEKYKERPIIYGAGLFILDGGDGDAGAYSLTIDADGVKSLTFTALRRSNGKVFLADRDKARINNEFLVRCRELGTEAALKNDGTIDVTFKPAPRGAVEKSEPPTIFDPSTVERKRIEPLTEPLPEWTVERVPEDARMVPVQFGPLKQVGYRVEPAVLTERSMLYVETYWTIDAPVKSECRFYIEGKSTRENDMPFYGAGADHEFADWQFPVSRWKPGVIYRERFGLRPPALNRTANVDLRIEIRVRIDGRWIGPFIGPNLIEMRLPEVPWYRRDFPDVINRSEPGHCWTAEQLAAVTGGRWLVEPPAGWYVQSVLRDMRFYERVEAPVLFVASRRSRYLFHTEGDPSAATFDNHSMVAKYADKIAGAIIDHEVEGLPTDLPLLLVEDSVKASIELGFAARRRFKGKTIAVAGDIGKTTTIKLLEHVLKDAGEVVVPYASENTLISAPTMFANVKAEAAYAITELSKEAIGARRGSMTYDLMPDAVIVTSNFGFDKDSEAEARVKVRVFCGAVKGGHAILNRDMKHYAIFEAAAKRHGLNVITFGRHADSTVRMPELKRGGAVLINGAEHRLDVALAGDQLYDALAVLALTSALTDGGGGASSVIDRLKAFEPKLDRPLESKSTLRVGLLRQNKNNFWHPQSTPYAMHFVADHFNIELFCFSVQDINFDDKTIDGVFLEGNRRIHRVVPFPNIVDNIVLHGERGEQVKRLERDCLIIRHDIYTDKQKTYEMLLKDGRFADYLIKSHVVDSFETFKKLLDQYHNDVVMKPAGGGGGDHIVHITLDDGRYLINLNNQKLSLAPDEFTAFYNKHFVERRHILQPYIVSRTRAGNPFDIRVHCRRGAGGRFKVTPFPRIGNADGVVSNIAAGGFSMKFETFLQTEFGNDWRSIYNRLIDFGKKFPEYYQSFWSSKLFDVGVDVGIARHGSDYDFKIFEVNTYIDGPFFEIEDAITHFEYYRYLDEIVFGM